MGNEEAGKMRRWEDRKLEKKILSNVDRGRRTKVKPQLLVIGYWLLV
jgi:hypothetical protein